MIAKTFSRLCWSGIAWRRLLFLCFAEESKQSLTRRRLIQHPAKRHALFGDAFGDADSKAFFPSAAWYPSAPTAAWRPALSAIVAKSAAPPKIFSELIDQLVTGPMTEQAANTACTAFKVSNIPHNRLGQRTL